MQMVDTRLNDLRHARQQANSGDAFRMTSFGRSFPSNHQIRGEGVMMVSRGNGRLDTYGLPGLPSRNEASRRDGEGYRDEW
jgi:hypothetical protein